MEGDEVAPFVSISLEPSESCSLCGQDTDEALVASCHLCQKHTSTSPLLKKGFGKLAADGPRHQPRPHAALTAAAHESCLARAHQLLRPARRSGPVHSPLPHRRGMSVPNDTSTAAATAGLYDRTAAPGDQLQWVLTLAKNDKNRQNLLQVRSSPCTRASSPDLFRALLAEEALLRRHSENDLGREPGSAELRQSYARYLYGSGKVGKVGKSNSEDNLGWKSRSNPNLTIDEAEDPAVTATAATATATDRIGRPQVLTLSPSDNRALSPPFPEPASPARLSPTVVLERTCGQLNLSGGSMPSTPTTPDGPGPDLRGRPDSDHPPWCNKQKIDNEQLNTMTAAEVKKVVATLENKIKDISAELVDLLQDRDSLGQEVRYRNLTIQKLVKMKHSQQDTPLKTTGVGNI